MPARKEPDQVCLDMAGCHVDLMESEDALRRIEERSQGSEDRRSRPLAVASANLDHLHHFGLHGASRPLAMVNTEAVEWLTLLDGAPLAVRARLLTGRTWPRLAGADLLMPVLVGADRSSCTVGFLGGTSSTLQAAVAQLHGTLPHLRVAGCWAPTRAQVTDPVSAGRLAHEVHDAGVDLLVVGLGKPRQEMWIQRHGHETGAAVLLAFGASTDFLAGAVQRAPGWVRHVGLEWGYRLAQEPRRMWRRYLVEGPAAALDLVRSCTVVATTPAPSTAEKLPHEVAAA